MGVRHPPLGAQLGDGVRTVAVIPFGSSGCEQRARNVKHVQAWIEQYHDYPVFIGESNRDPFSPAQARNNGAAQAGDWDVCLFWDADTLAHPDAVREAATLAADNNQVVFAANGHIYMDELSTQRFIHTGLMFPTPTDWPDTRRQRFQFDQGSVYRDPSGGILAVNRGLWTATGGYCDSLGGEDSHEDLVFFACAQIFGGGVTRVAGMQLHLYHPPAPRIKGANHRHYRQLVNMMGRPNTQQRARDYLAALGHVVP